MNTTTKAEREVFVIMDGVERGPFPLTDLHRDAMNGTPAAEDLWRFTSDQGYRSVSELVQRGPESFVPPSLPKRKQSHLGPPIALIAFFMGIIGVFLAVGVLILVGAIHFKKQFDQYHEANQAIEEAKRAWRR